MNTKQRLLSLLAASSLAAFAPACGGTDPVETEGADAHESSGGEAEAACGGGACGAATEDGAAADDTGEEASQ